MKRRINNIFAKDSKTFILAMDHGVVMDVASSFASPKHLIEKAVAGGVDAILTSYGIAQEFCKEIGNTGLILRVDGGSTALHPDGEVFRRPIRTFSVEDAVRLGADGILCMGWTGVPDEELTMQNLSYFAGECKKYGLVFGAEMIPGGFGKEDKSSLDNIAFSNRLGAEYGADFIKSPFKGEPEHFREKVINTCFKPVVVLGGGSSRTTYELLAMIKKAMDAGCKGVVIGRNIWMHEKVEKLCKAISSLIHDDISVDEGVALVDN